MNILLSFKILHDTQTTQLNLGPIFIMTDKMSREHTAHCPA